MGDCPGNNSHAPFLLPVQHPWKEGEDHNNPCYVSMGLIFMQKLFGSFTNRNLKHV